ncbi:hypothetical protein TYRP_007062 [Tyrophagus putrescentiae]|nr:hypothetical protein TYRP_007062 [Tyrophagus putrescentiae]
MMINDSTEVWKTLSSLRASEFCQRSELIVLITGASVLGKSRLCQLLQRVILILEDLEKNKTKSLTFRHFKNQTPKAHLSVLIHAERLSQQRLDALRKGGRVAQRVATSQRRRLVHQQGHALRRPIFLVLLDALQQLANQRVARVLLEPLLQRLKLLVQFRLPFLALLAAQVEAVLGDVLELLAIKVGYGADGVLVDGVRQVEHLVALLQEALHKGRGGHLGDARPGDVRLKLSVGLTLGTKSSDLKVTSPSAMKCVLASGASVSLVIDL